MDYSKYNKFFNQLLREHIFGGITNCRSKSKSRLTCKCLNPFRPRNGKPEPKGNLKGEAELPFRELEGCGLLCPPHFRISVGIFYFNCLNSGMKLSFSILMMLGLAGLVWAQQPSATKALPMPLYIRLLDSTTSIDVVFMQGKGGSISVEGRNAKLFNSFFENTTTPKLNTPQAGSMMWEINGREFISGNFYLGDSTGCIIFTKNGKEYVNRINGQGNTFFKNQIKK